MKTRPVFKCECGNHAWVALTKGLITRFDPEFSEAIQMWNWYAHHDKDKKYYVRHTYHETIAGKKHSISMFMHRMILPASVGFSIDHKDGDTLNNLRSNLRLATVSQNGANMKKGNGSLSKYKGVSPFGSSWRALIGVRGKQLYLGKFKTEEEAARAYDAAALKHHGDFSRLNFNGEA